MVQTNDHQRKEQYLQEEEENPQNFQKEILFCSKNVYPNI